jgi:hypothetical protein
MMSDPMKRTLADYEMVARWTDFDEMTARGLAGMLFDAYTVGYYCGKAEAEAAAKMGKNDG